MRYDRITLGFAPCAALDVHSEEALVWREKIMRILAGLGVQTIDIRQTAGLDFICTRQEAVRAGLSLRDAHVDGVFYPVFGRDAALAPLAAREADCPSLLWSERTSAQIEEGLHLTRDACGVFESAKVFRRLAAAYTSIPSCFAESEEFERGLRVFCGACAARRAMSQLRILQIGPCEENAAALDANEGELLRRFGVQVVSVSLSVLKDDMDAVLYKQGADWAATRAMILRKMDCGFVPESVVDKIAAMKLAIMRLCEEYACGAVIIAATEGMRRTMDIYPGAAAGLLTEEGIPVVCGADFCGAISSVILSAAAQGASSSAFFARIAARSPKNERAVLLYDEGGVPVSLASEAVPPVLGEGPEHDGCFGCGQWRLKEGAMTLCRFDGENGAYRLFAMETHTCEGPAADGTYAWIDIDWEILEKTLLAGGYAPRFACIYAQAIPVLKELCRYLDIAADMEA